MRVLFVIFISIFIFSSCGPQEGTDKRNFYTQGQYPSNPAQPGNPAAPPPSPGGINQQTSQNYLGQLESQYNCGPRWRSYHHSTNFSLTSIESLQNGPIQGNVIKKVYIGKTPSSNSIIYIEQVSDNGTDTKGMNITFSFCKQKFPGIFFEGRNINYRLNSSIILDSDANKTYNSVDSSSITLDFAVFQTVNEYKQPITISPYSLPVVFSKVQ